MDNSYLFIPSPTESCYCQRGLLKYQQCHHTIPAFHLRALCQPLRRRTIPLRRNLLPCLSRLLVPLHHLMLRGKMQWTARGSEDAKGRLQYQIKRQCKTRSSIALPWRNQPWHANANRVDLVAATSLMSQPTWEKTARAGMQSTEIQQTSNGDTE
jgi:hypothetical protein